MEKPPGNIEEGSGDHGQKSTIGGKITRTAMAGIAAFGIYKALEVPLPEIPHPVVNVEKILPKPQIGAKITDATILGFRFDVSDETNESHYEVRLLGDNTLMLTLRDASGNMQAEIQSYNPESPVVKTPQGEYSFDALIRRGKITW
jgi:hypothetical protein